MTQIRNENSDLSVENASPEASSNLLHMEEMGNDDSEPSTGRTKDAGTPMIVHYIEQRDSWSEEALFQERMTRMKEATGVRTQLELAMKLHVRQSSISEAAKRRKVPDTWYMKLAENFGLNPLYLKWGVGPKQLLTAGGGIAPFSLEPQTPAHVLLSLFKDILLPELAETAVSQIYITSDMLTEILPEIFRRILPNDLAELVISNMDCKKLFR